VNLLVSWHELVVMSIDPRPPN